MNKLSMLDAAPSLDSLRIPVSNNLEALKGDFSGFFSIRVNDQFRIVFRWDGGAHDVRISKQYE